ncbi:uncharacterized protein LOC127249777 [Andrographis paniculata]|uniref:uncharacterized protein LOC127249777 n=1 Tax=Andrographis paniculata TaxID=175694 RepID=UPI0021E8C73E|nr:uncharacterized protein LOC127249777 [Andrographis paniculata]
MKKLSIVVTLLLLIAVSAAAGDDSSGMDGIIFGPGMGFGVPGLGPVSGFVRPTVVCREKGPCYRKKLTCPRKCFRSFNRSGKGYGYGGGGGGCTMDCKNKCIASCSK